MDEQTRNKQVVAQLFAALNERRFDELGRLMSATVVDHNKVIFAEHDRPGAAFRGVPATVRRVQ